jgi:ABC-type transport system involved in multi-copper enzyme maturation permease subunit
MSGTSSQEPTLANSRLASTPASATRSPGPPGWGTLKPVIPWWGAQVRTIALNTFREAVRDRVLYNLIAFALLLVGAAILVGQISVGVERLVVVNLGLTAISMFGIVIAIFIGIGLVSKEIDKKTVYVLLTRPLGRWQFILGKFCGLAGTLAVNAALMSVGFFAALLYVTGHFQRTDAWLLVAIYFIVLELVLVTALALLFSSFSTPLESAVMAFAIFVIGTFAEDLRAFAGAAKGAVHWLAMGVAYLLPNFATFNVITSVAHEQPVASQLILWNTVYALLYAGAAVAGAMLIFEKRNLK